MCPPRLFTPRVRSNDQQNWFRFLNACNKGKLTFSPVDEVVYYEYIRVGCSYTLLII